MLRPFTRFLFLLVLPLLLLSACGLVDHKCGCAPPPGLSDAQVVHTWKLNQTWTGDQQTATGAQIKDQYTLELRPQGGYTQTILATNDAYAGTWRLTDSGHSLVLTDHKGDAHTYSVDGAWPHGGTQPEQLLLYSQNKDQVREKLVFDLQP